MGLKKHDRPVTDETRAQVRALHAEGHGRNEIARRLERSPRTVSVLAAEMGLTFDRTATAVATEARMVDARTRRAALIHRAYTRAEKIYDRLEADQTSGYNFTATTVNGIETETLDHVPAQDERALAMAAGQHLTQATKLEALDGDPANDDARSMLLNLSDALRRAAGPPEDDTGED